MGKWEFLPNPGREEEGLGHAGIETFKSSPYPGIARECSQNSLDAAARTHDEDSEPVHLIFRLVSVDASDVPGLSDLKTTLRSCLSQWKDQKKEREFFEQAIKVAEQSRVAVLSIEDYGTTGLTGPAVKGKPFHALVKSTGVRQKSDSDAGGSFGIGKNAAFAVSRLRTVFYSTIYSSGEGVASLVQGKSILVSHDQGGEPRRATGYWGASEYMPVEHGGALPQWLRRAKVGTTVASVGFDAENGWQWLMTESLVRNFFSAISNGAIRFTVQSSESDAIEIDANSVAELFEREEVRAAAESTGTTDDLEFSAAMLAALRSGDSESQVQHFEGAGSFRVTILQREGFPRRVGILRNGMYIADNLRHFGHPMARFPMSRDFVAILQPEDRGTSGVVRDMESPRHDEISADRLDDLVRRRKLKLAMKKVGDWIRGAIKSATTKPGEADILLDEMNRFFSKPSAGQSIPDPANRDDDPERSRITANQMPSKPLLGAGGKGESGSAGGEKKSGNAGGKTSGQRPGKGRGAVGGRGGNNIAYAELRNSASQDGSVRKLAFTPEAAGVASLEISAVGISSDEALAIRSINGAPCSKSPRIELRAGERINIDVELDVPYRGPISVVLSSLGEGANAD